MRLFHVFLSIYFAIALASTPVATREPLRTLLSSLRFPKAVNVAEGAREIRKSALSCALHDLDGGFDYVKVMRVVRLPTNDLVQAFCPRSERCLQSRNTRTASYRNQDCAKASRPLISVFPSLPQRRVELSQTRRFAARKSTFENRGFGGGNRHRRSGSCSRLAGARRRLTGGVQSAGTRSGNRTSSRDRANTGFQTRICSHRVCWSRAGVEEGGLARRGALRNRKA